MSFTAAKATLSPTNIWKIYRQKILDAQSLALELMAEHGLIKNGWTFSYVKKRRSCGSCNWQKKTIFLSVYHVVLNDMEVIKDTILHEIAHYYTPKSNHDANWKATAIRLGCNPRAKADKTVKRVPREIRWTASCMCGTKHQKSRKPTVTYECKFCKNTLFWQPVENVLFIEA